MAFDRDFFADPYPAYAEWREKSGAYRVALPGNLDGWVITGYAEGRAALNDPRLSKSAANEMFARAMGRQVPVTGGSLTSHMLNSDPPDHTRLRKLVQKAFTTRRVAALRPRVEEIAAERLDAMASHEVVDLIESYALPIPVTVICELLGVPYADRAVFSAGGHGLMEGGRTQELFLAALKQLREYLTDLVAAKRADPGDDLLSELTRARDDGDNLSDTEIISMAFLLLIAGHETTVNLIGNATDALLRHPGQLAALRADPALLPAAIEEFLRYEGSVNIATLRYTTEPVTIAGTEIPAGEFVHVALIGGNRDPERFPDPDRLDITRDATGHLAFGHGIHHCLGAPLARLEAQVALSALLARFPDLRLADPGQSRHWHPNVRFRGLTALPVRLDAMG